MCGIGVARPSYKTATVQNSNGNVRTQKRVTTRMELNSSAVTAPMAVLAWMIARLPGKALVVLLIGAIMRWSAPVSVRAALILAQGGEDGLLLLTQAMRVGAIELNVGNLLSWPGPQPWPLAQC